MLDFHELGSDGTAFELLIREVAFTEGFATYWSGVGPDGGKDLLCRQRVRSILGEFEKIWLIQCKHFAHSGRSVGTDDITNIIDVCRHHGATGYIVATSTYPSSALIQRLHSISVRPENNLETTVWDSAFLERILTTPETWAIAQRFFPDSSKGAEWVVHATTSPNCWVINFKGHHIHLSNRIGSRYKYHFDSIRNRLEDMTAIELPEHHFFRMRAVWYDDKNGGYQYYLDYMCPQGDRPKYSKEALAQALGDGEVLEDGQYYAVDVAIRAYNEDSDHYDKDHYDYYVPYMGSFLVGEKRFVREGLSYYGDDVVLQSDNRPVSAVRDRPFERFKNALDGHREFKLVRAVNANPEAFRLFSDTITLSSVAERQKISWANVLTAEFLFIANDEEKFYNFATLLPQDFPIVISVYKRRLYLPPDEGRGSRMIEGEDSFVLSVQANDFLFPTVDEVRRAFNEFYIQAAKNIEQATAEAAGRPYIR